MKVQINLPKTGEILIYCPKLGSFPAKDIVLRYKADQFLFDVLERGRCTGWIGEREALNNIENGFYVLPINN